MPRLVGGELHFKPKADIVEWEETGSYYETEKKYG